MTTGRFLSHQIQVHGDKYAVNLGSRYGWRFYDITSFDDPARESEIRWNYFNLTPLEDSVHSVVAVGLMQALEFHKTRIQEQKNEKVKALAMSIRISTRINQGQNTVSRGRASLCRRRTCGWRLQVTPLLKLLRQTRTRRMSRWLLGRGNYWR